MRHRPGFALFLLITLVRAGAQENSAMKATREMQGAARAPNRLAKATSPYLLQHSRNPVDWHEWGEEAFSKAKSENKPIFLSIGYAACHWCHVMEHECFEQDDVAAVLNANLVSIKVDREERPDIDELYMAYTQAATGGGGWPMSVFLTPEGVPFHAGTYFPKQHFIPLLNEIARMWREQRNDVLKGASGATEFLKRWSRTEPAAEGVISKEVVDATAVTLARYFDRSQGGLSGGSNKFPPSMAMDLLLRVHRRTGNADLAEAVDITLDHMARGGIYDHLGGGICRYSTDPQWLVPHFEKMLYDQAMVSAIYLDGYLALKKPQYAAVARDIFDYVLADLRSPDGAFYSSRDADSEGLEGKFYLWTVLQVLQVLGEEDGKLFCQFYDVTEQGNWFERMGHAPPGPKNILHIAKPPELFARLNNLDPEAFLKKLSVWRGKMHKARNQRIPPGLDDKILTDWNGLMIASLAKGAAILDEPKYAQAAAQAADFILTKMQNEGRLLRTYRAGQARLTATLSDYAFLIEGLLNLYEATFERHWLDQAERLTDTTIRFYFDEKDSAFFYTASDGEKLLVRSKQPQDNAIPSGNSVHALNLQRLAVLLGRKDYREKAESIFRAFAIAASDSPGQFDRLLCAADFYHDTVKEIALIGGSPRPLGEGLGVRAEIDNRQSKINDSARALLRTVYNVYLPNKVVAWAAEKVADERIPLLAGKTLLHGEPAAYVCENFHCQKPVREPAELALQLRGRP